MQCQPSSSIRQRSYIADADASHRDAGHLCNVPVLAPPQAADRFDTVCEWPPISARASSSTIPHQARTAHRSRATHIKRQKLLLGCSALPRHHPHAYALSARGLQRQVGALTRPDALAATHLRSQLHPACVGRGGGVSRQGSMLKACPS